MCEGSANYSAGEMSSRAPKRVDAYAVTSRAHSKLTRIRGWENTHRKAVLINDRLLLAHWPRPSGIFLAWCELYKSLNVIFLTDFSLMFRLVCVFFMVALCNRADHYIFILFLSFFLSFFLFFPRLISAVGDWMSTILRHMVWS